jgi:rfaE bifunctional protein nucleotidyltransferase chain/domain
MPVIVFTNGCFDVLHRGHVELLTRARALGDRLVVGLNSDASVRALKGPDRPFVAQADRAAVLRGLRSVDGLVLFDELTPIQLIAELRPDILVKGGDWPADRIVGAELVRRYGGRVVSLPLLEGYGTTALAARIAARLHTSGPADICPPVQSAGPQWPRT